MTDMYISKTAFRIPLFGESKVGKSCILNKYLHNKFEEEYLTTLGLDKNVKKTKIKDSEKGEIEISLLFIDTAGQERFRSITTQGFKSADGFFVVFSVTDKLSFEQVMYWMQQIREYNDKLPIILIGNKIDLVEEREVQKADAENLAQKLGVEYFETSAKTGEGIQEAFERLCNKTYETNKQLNRKQPNDDPGTIIIGKNKNNENKDGCCKKKKTNVNKNIK